MIFITFNLFGAEPQIVKRDTDDTKQHSEIADPFCGPFPEPDDPWNVRILGQTTVGLRVTRIVKYVDDMGAANPGWIIDSRVLKTRLFSELLGTCFGEFLHVWFRAEMET